MAKSLTAAFNDIATPPAGWQENFFLNPRDERLRYGFAPAAGDGERRGTVVMTHGYGEHIELYYHAIKHYQAQGFDVWMMEWQGHGRSDRDDPVCECGEKPSPRGMMQHARDLKHFVNHVVHNEGDKPLIMSTNSMGGHIGLLVMKAAPDMFDGTVMSTPMFDIARLGAPPAARPVMKFIFDMVAKTPWGDRQLPGDIGVLNWLTGLGNNIKEPGDETGGLRREWNEAARRKYADLQIDRPTWAWVSSAYETIVPSLKESFLRAVKTPMLIGSAGRDNLVDNAAHVRVADITGAELLSLPTAEHSLWFENDGNYDSWTARVNAFLDRVAPARARDAAPPAPEEDIPVAALRNNPGMRLAA